MLLETIRNATSEKGPFLCVISGGMDSAIATAVMVHLHSNKHVQGVSFYYGQKQVKELVCARSVCEDLGIPHTVINVKSAFPQEGSANTDPSIPVPTMDEILGDPQPITYVPNRNMIFLSVAAAYAEATQSRTIVVGLQTHDEYGYFDTTSEFVAKMNAVLQLNRKHSMQIYAPFIDCSKSDELRVFQEFNDDLSLLKTTVTCYAPDYLGRSCGTCPSCSERINAFARCGLVDPIQYV